jgi:hypothetical protein
MPCYDCRHWKRSLPSQQSRSQPSGWCVPQGRITHPNYQCIRWQERTVSHEEVGLTPFEVAWARAHPEDATVRALNLMFRRIQFQPHETTLRAEFADALGDWRFERANPRPTEPTP